MTGDLWAATLAVRTIQLWMQWCVQATQKWANSLELYTKLGRRKGHSIMVNEGPQIFHLTWLANSKEPEPIPKSQIWSDPTNQFKRIPTIWWLTQMNPYLDSKFTRTRQQLNLSGIGVAGQLKNMLPFVSNQQTWQKSMHNILIPAVFLAPDIDFINICELETANEMDRTRSHIWIKVLWTSRYLKKLFKKSACRMTYSIHNSPTKGAKKHELVPTQNPLPECWQPPVKPVNAGPSLQWARVLLHPAKASSHRLEQNLERPFQPSSRLGFSGDDHFGKLYIPRLFDYSIHNICGLKKSDFYNMEGYIYIYTYITNTSLIKKNELEWLQILNTLSCRVSFRGNIYLFISMLDSPAKLLPGIKAPWWCRLLYHPAHRST